MTTGQEQDCIPGSQEPCPWVQREIEHTAEVHEQKRSLRVALRDKIGTLEAALQRATDRIRELEKDNAGFLHIAREFDRHLGECQPAHDTLSQERDELQKDIVYIHEQHDTERQRFVTDYWNATHERDTLHDRWMSESHRADSFAKVAEGWKTLADRAVQLLANHQPTSSRGSDWHEDDAWLKDYEAQEANYRELTKDTPDAAD